MTKQQFTLLIIFIVLMLGFMIPFKAANSTENVTANVQAPTIELVFPEYEQYNRGEIERYLFPTSNATDKYLLGGKRVRLKNS